MQYPFQEVESFWQKFWEEHKSFQTNIRSSKPKFYCLDMFPYPSGAGLHVGHPEGYTATDILSRFKRMKGFEVLHPMGWDAFGLPAERYAMQTGIHPAITTKNNIDNFRRQIQMIGLSYDWSRELSTTDPDYYKFTQWIFIQLYQSWFNPELNKAESINELIRRFSNQGSSGLDYRQFNSEEWKEFSPNEKEKILSDFRLVYQAEIPVNWCEGLGTVLANEEVEEWVGKGYEVVRKPMRQYMMRITAYADRLLEDLKLVEWPSSTLEMQKNWIGKSEGLEIIFPFPKPLQSGLEGIRIFTTRPDTIFGVTYMVVAPEHPIVSEITTPEQKQKVEEYQKVSSLKSDLDRMELNKEKQEFLQELLFSILQILPKKFQFGSATTCYTDMELEQSWPFRLTTKETLNLQKPLDLKFFRLSKVKFRTRHSILKLLPVSIPLLPKFRLMDWTILLLLLKLFLGQNPKRSVRKKYNLN